MGLFTDLWFGLKPVKPAPTPPIATPAPTPPEPPAPVPEPSAALIQIEYKNIILGWRKMTVPFAGNHQIDVGRVINRTWAKFRITVLSGSLTITSTVCSGPHNPKISKYPRNQVFKAGDIFPIDCSMGARTGGKHGHHDEVNYCVYAREFGSVPIINFSATVAY